MAVQVKGLLLLLVAVNFVAGKSVYQRKNASSISALKAMSGGNEKFSFDLLQAIDSDKEENLVVSPFSLHVALGFLSEGAQGSSKQQILQAAYLSAGDITQAGFKELLAPLREVDWQTNFMLANMLYFNGTWENGFNASLTKKQPFYVDNQTTVQTDMMTTRAGFNYTYNRQLNAQVLALNYKGRDVRMLIILPGNVGGLRNLESKITSLETVTANLSPQQVNLTMPKFKIQKELEYSNVLKKLGISDIFSAAADLRNISESDSLQVSQVKQKAIIEVGEKGTQAAAAAAATGTAEATEALPHDFNADHGFLFLLEHTPTKSASMHGRHACEVCREPPYQIGPKSSRTGDFLHTDAGGPMSTPTGNGTAEATEALPHDFIADHGFLFLLEHTPTKSVIVYGRYAKP